MGISGGDGSEWDLPITSNSIDEDYPSSIDWANISNMEDGIHETVKFINHKKFNIIHINVNNNNNNRISRNCSRINNNGGTNYYNYNNNNNDHNNNNNNDDNNNSNNNDNEYCWPQPEKGEEVELSSQPSSISSLMVSSLS
ncbi:hypothetical protein Glove_57g86 [Diversispora epigaea]|uniref:Uncharacterized protein n=1 Tax=Diversispora epigaea TaxID=1348612 RepID=A0A397JNF8_9GLOM|nr:hypothetical protein Glove_57g86 [Diversispora epigaea]